MTNVDCAEMELLLQADFDGELDVAGTARIAAHLAQCPDCAATQSALARLSARLRTELPDEPAPARLRRAIEAMIAAPGTPPIPTGVHLPARRAAPRRRWFQRVETWIRHALPIGAGAALAAVVLVMILPRGGDLPESVVASHIRALQPGHLMDVVSTDQHTVQPWFDGRLDFAPPVKDLASQGFPLVGGRLDFLAGRPVAALAYHRAQHVIDLYVWPGSGHVDARAGSGERNGYHYVRWNENEMAFWAVSDLNKAELGEFVERWQAAQ